MLLTQQDEQKYMGIINPDTGAMHVFHIMAMGTRKSPGASRRFGTSFIRHVINNVPEFQGTPVGSSLST